MKFYHSTATCSTATHIVLTEAKVNFSPVEVSWKRNVKVEELAKVNPLGSVPALELDDGRVLTQNAAIFEYIADAHPEARLLPPPGTWERAQAMSWISFASADLHKAFFPIIGANRMTKVEAAHNDLRAFARDNVKKYLAHIDQQLNGKNYILGKEFSAPDAYLFVVIGWCKWAEIPVAPYSNVMAYMKRVAERASVREVLKKEELTDYLPA